jgi:hypothetical protein
VVQTVTDTGILIIMIAFGTGALLWAIVPGLVFGIPIGMFISRRDVGFVACLAVSVVGAFVASRWVKNPHAFDLLAFSVILGALVMTSLGAWIGRKL